MCGACGLLVGGSDWADGSAEHRGGAAGHSRLVERQRRIALVNRLLAAAGVRLSEQGRHFIVRGATGRTQLVTDLAHVWVMADRLGRHPVDPLDDALLARLDRGA